MSPTIPIENSYITIGTYVSTTLVYFYLIIAHYQFSIGSLKPLKVICVDALFMLGNIPDGLSFKSYMPLYAVH